MDMGINAIPIDPSDFVMERKSYWPQGVWGLLLLTLMAFLLGLVMVVIFSFLPPIQTDGQGQSDAPCPQVPQQCPRCPTTTGEGADPTIENEVHHPLVYFLRGISEELARQNEEAKSVGALTRKSCNCVNHCYGPPPVEVGTLGTVPKSVYLLEAMLRTANMKCEEQLKQIKATTHHHIREVDLMRKIAINEAILIQVRQSGSLANLNKFFKHELELMAEGKQDLSETEC